MANKTALLLPSTNALLREFGDRLQLARKRRRLPAKQVAERAGMSPMTLRSLERGNSGVTMGAYLAVMQVLGVETDIALLAKADPLGRELQDANLRAPKKPATPAQTIRATAVALPATKAKLRKPTALEPSSPAKNLTEIDGFTSSASLAQLIEVPAIASKKAP
jgi:transcriptional regulator with XRE-family HTH domain